MGLYIKVIVIAAVLLIPTFLFFNFVLDSAFESPIPTDPAVTCRDFFTCLQDKPDDDFFRARELLAAPTKLPIIWDASMIHYVNGNLERIRNYLIKRVGPDFAADIQVAPAGGWFNVTFKNDIVIRCDTSTKWGLDEKNHFSIESILDFPTDYFPSLGVEQRNRDLAQLMDSLSQPEVEEAEVVDDPQTALDIRTGEPPQARLERLILSFHYARMLDIEHDIFDAILEEFPNDPATYEFLRDITDEEYSTGVHLKKKAREILDKTVL